RRHTRSLRDWSSDVCSSDLGQFYSSPAVAFGRVYMGNTDGRVYSFGARTGTLAWATSTGAYVYASPAVADLPALGPTVYIGSYEIGRASCRERGEVSGGGGV